MAENLNRSKLVKLISEMREIQKEFLEQHGVNDIWSNSKIYEVLQANTLGHTLIPGHSGSLDAKDGNGNEFEYKHFKKSSSNHSWTFNDYSETTIAKLREKVHAVIFAHINDDTYPPIMDWSYEGSGSQIADYLDIHTKALNNTRRMINISENQLLARTSLKRTSHKSELESGLYGAQLERIFQIISDLEELVEVKGILTSNKFWEVLVSLPLGHTVNSEQGGRSGDHDAWDENGGDYEYKVSSSRSWNFQDISEAVLKKYLHCEEIVLAIVDKPNISLIEVWMAKPNRVVSRLEEKLAEKIQNYEANGKEVRRLQVTLSAGDLAAIGATKVI